MPIPTAIAVYFVLWWIVLFAVLPIGTQPIAEADSETGWRGVPARARMGRKLLITTLVTAVVWLLIWLTIESGWISFRTGWLALPDR